MYVHIYYIHTYITYVYTCVYKFPTLKLDVQSRSPTRGVGDSIMLPTDTQLINYELNLPKTNVHGARDKNLQQHNISSTSYDKRQYIF